MSCKMSLVDGWEVKESEGKEETRESNPLETGRERVVSRGEKVVRERRRLLSLSGTRSGTRATSPRFISPTCIRSQPREMQRPVLVEC